MERHDIITSLIIEAMQDGATTPKEIVDRIAGSYTIDGKEVIKDGIISNGQEITERGGNG